MEIIIPEGKMKNKIFTLCIFIIFCICFANVAFAAEADTVYLDGTGATEGAYADFKTAVSALPSGGTVIVSGDTAIGTSSAGVTLAAVGGKVTVTGENGAVLTLARSLTLASEIEFNNITIKNTHASNGRIIANGNKITMGEGVVTETIVDRYPSIIGGRASGTCKGSHVVIKSGTWFIVFGGSYGGTFNGDSTVDFTGGTVKAVITGGNRAGNFTGNATLNIGGSAVVEYNKDDENADYMGVIGGSMGLKSSTTAYIFSGNIAVNIFGNASVAANVLGASRYAHITTNGDITITVSENAALTRNIYAGGYYGGVTTGEGGIKVILKDNVTVGTNRYVCAGSLNAGTVTGNGRVEFYDNAKLIGAVYAGGYSGGFEGSTAAVLYGGEVTSTFSAASRSGSVSGTQSILLKNGTVGGEVKGDATIELDMDSVVNIGSCSGNIITTVPEGYELVTDGKTYSAKETGREIPTLLYVNGNASESGDGFSSASALKSLEEAVLLLENGGTIVVCGDVNIDREITLSAGDKLVITSVYGSEDYTSRAAIGVANNIILGVETEFNNIVLDRTAYGNDYIIAKGNVLTIGENVFCRNTLATNYISIVGGALSGNFAGSSNIIVKSGYFRNVIGGNYNGSFSGTSNITLLGGYYDNAIIGGTFMGNFEGDATVNIGGDAAMIYLSSTQGVIGSCCGSGSSAYTFTGDIKINLYGNCRINNSVYGAARYENVTTTGNVEITIKDDAFVYQNVYAGGYNGVLNGNTRLIMDSGWVGVNLAAGSRGGTVNGDTYLEVNGGKLNYYNTNHHSSMSDAPGEYNVSGGGLTGAVIGNTEVVINGGDIYGNVYGGGISTGAVSGNSTVTISGGSIMCGVYADGKAEGSVAGTKALNIDLSGGGSLSLGLAANVNSFTGGGSLTLFPEATVKADSLSGNIVLSINGIPQARAYITATSTDNASVTYTAQGSEIFAESVGETATEYKITSEGYFATTKVTFKHLDGVQIYMRASLATDSEKLVAASSSANETVFDIAPGIYNYVVYHAQDDYKRKYLYITGKDEEITLDFTSYTPKTGGGFEAGRFLENTEEIYNTYYNTEDLVGFEIPDTPYFANNRYGTRLFTSNAEMNAFVREKVAQCDYAYSYKLFTSPDGTAVPVVVFTNDTIPENGTLENTARIITENKDREIILVTAFVHGNEPSAGEGALAIISELCTDYGKSILNKNIGAIVIIPRLNPDGSKAFTRETPTAVGESNLNRDYAMLTSAEIQGVVRAYDLFAPTVTIDCHEAPLDPIWGESYTLSDIYDVGIMTGGALNTSLANATAAVKGDYNNRGTRALELVTDVLSGIESSGLRPYYYQTPMTHAGNATAYGLIKNSYSFLIEVPGISGGDAVFARRVFAQATAMKEIFELVANADGQIAAEVNSAKNALALSAQKFDINTPIVLQHAYTRHDSSTVLWNNPLVFADSTTVKADNSTKYYIQDVAVKYRSRPTAYVISADIAGVDKVLNVLDGQGIEYSLLDAGTTLTLKQYSGSAASATLGAANDVTFASGAYIIPVDGDNANLTASLFEPENIDSGDYIVTFAQSGYISASDIYRSEESFIAAKLGLSGTYIEAAIPAGKEFASALVDGVLYEDAAVEDSFVYLPASKSEFYRITLSFSDGTTETVSIGQLKGDADGDESITVIDVILLLRSLLNSENGFDMNGDGKFGLVDIIRVMKLAVSA